MLAEIIMFRDGKWDTQIVVNSHTQGRSMLLTWGMLPLDSEQNVWAHPHNGRTGHIVPLVIDEVIYGPYLRDRH